MRVYTSFHSCAWPAGVLVVEGARTEDDDKAREGSDLYLQLGGPTTESPNGGTQLWTLPLSTLKSGGRIWSLTPEAPAAANWRTPPTSSVRNMALKYSG